MKTKQFGITRLGEKVESYTIENEVASVTIITFGGIIQEFKVHGMSIVGGYDTIADYEADDSHQGGLIGRIANRVANACFEMDGKTYRLPKNDGENCLHGGNGFDRRVWKVEKTTENSISLALRSADGEEGFPGALNVTVVYRLEGGDLLIDYAAIPEAKTPIALTNHAYFNLNGFGGTIDSHMMTIYADRYTETNAAILPTGNRPEVLGTPFDFTTPHPVGGHFANGFDGYDHNFILNPKMEKVVCGVSLPLIATLEGEALIMDVCSDQKGMQVYTGNFLGGKPDFSGRIPRVKHGAICLETQTEPGAISRGEIFYEKGQTYRHQTVYSVRRRG